MSYKVMSFFFISIIVLSNMGCTTKNNPVGFQPGVKPHEIYFDYQIFSQAFSYEDSVRNYAGNNKLLAGNFTANGNQNQAYTLIRNLALPDSVFSLESACTLKIYINQRHNWDEVNNQNLQIGKVNNYWHVNQADWFNSTDTTSWSENTGFSESDFELLNILNLEDLQDSLLITLPDSLVLGWVNNDSLNFGITIFGSEENSFIEFNSMEENSPLLIFDYRESSSDTLKTYSNNITADTFIYSSSEEFQQFPLEILLANSRPVKSFIRFTLMDTMFINADSSGIENQLDYSRMTINNAELILSAITDDSYPLSGSISLTPYLVLQDSLILGDVSAPVFATDDYETLYDGASTDSLNTTEFSLKLTQIIQSITSGERENYGILISSILENKDFVYQKFAGPDHPDESLRPRLKIIYTPPYLDE